MARLLPTAVMSAALLFCLPITNAADSRSGSEVDLDIMNQIRQEGLHRSQVMNTLQHLTDVIGPRLTGSPGMDEANAYTRDRLTEFGLSNARLEGFDFGKGWSFDRVSVL